MRRWAAWGLVAAAAALVVAAAAVVFSALERYRGPGPLAAETAVVVPAGAGVATIADLLAERGVIRDPFAFRLAARLAPGEAPLRAGEFAFPAGVSLRQAIAVLRHGKTVVRRLTVPEGLTSAEVVALVQGAEGLAGAVGSPPGEGTLLPETYHYSWGDTRRAMIGRMAEAMLGAVAELWASRAPGLALGDPDEAVILASIVEKETALAEERALVAGVFLNRLDRGMRLQSDPTVVYALTGGAGRLGRPLTRADLDHPSPYNTYRVDGLPPGPIANPGRAALAAAMNPAETEALYFVADGTGGHVFARTLDEHNRNVRRWRRLRREDGE